MPRESIMTPLPEIGSKLPPVAEVQMILTMAARAVVLIALKSGGGRTAGGVGVATVVVGGTIGGF